MSDAIRRLRRESCNWSFPDRPEQRAGVNLVWAMLDVIDAAETLVNGDPDPVAVDGAWDALAMRLDRFREVAS